MNKQISLLGCGWLGLPLAKALIEKGFSVKGSTTSESKLSVLKENNIEPFQIKLLEDNIEGNITEFLTESEILIIDIPPGLRKDTSVSFVAKIKTLVTQIEQSSIKKLLFVSSTSVYEDTYPITEVTEVTPTNPDSERGKQLVEVEQMLLVNQNFFTTIIRFGGLIGEDRHPIQYLAGKENVANPDGPINFIHLEDCIGIIEAIVEKGLRQAQSDNKEKNEFMKRVQIDKVFNNQVFNVVAPQHPSRQEYYHKKAKNMNLALPIFAENSKSVGKIVSSAKLMDFLSYTFIKEI